MGDLGQISKGTRDREALSMALRRESNTHGPQAAKMQSGARKLIYIGAPDETQQLTKKHTLLHTNHVP
jgi:hypothetical protein